MNNEQKINKLIDEKIANGREYRKMQSFEIRAAEDSGDKKVGGYASVFNEPYLIRDWGDYKIYEQIDKNAFDGCDMSDVIMQYNHEGRVFARISNNTLEVKTDDVGLEIEADLSGTRLGADIFEEIDGGYTTKMSFGFSVAEDKREITENREDNITTVLRTITKISKLYDVSAVSIPANDATEISARCYCDGLIAELEAERRSAEEVKLNRRRLAIRARALKGAKNED